MACKCMYCGEEWEEVSDMGLQLFHDPGQCAQNQINNLMSQARENAKKTVQTRLVFGAILLFVLALGGNTLYQLNHRVAELEQQVMLLPAASAQAAK